MKIFRVAQLFIVINVLFYSNTFSNDFQYDSLRIKISQMLIFGIQDVQKVLEADSMLEAYSNNHLGGIILF